jgi:hypothetical protein
VTFPSGPPSSPLTSVAPSFGTAAKKPRISAHFLNLKKPSDVTEETLRLLNVTFQPECDFETLLASLSNDAQSYLPPEDWLEPPEHIDLLMSSGSSIKLLSNGRRVPDQNEFYVRARELLFRNGDAFSTLTRKGAKGQAPLRLAHFRKFWEGLDNMAYYWDNSLDEYHSAKSVASSIGGATSSHTSAVSTEQGSLKMPNETKASHAGLGLGSPRDEEPRKKPKIEPADNNTGCASTPSNDTPNGSRAVHVSSSISSRTLPARTAPTKIPWAASLEANAKSVDLSNGYYKGYRIGNGAEMPDQYRIECVRAFVEPIAWAFGVTLSQHRRPPVLELENVRFPVRMSSVAWRGHQDRAKARQGYVQGPLLGIQCRADVDFGSTGDLHADSVLDNVRELGGLLLLAQERAREGKAEKRTGDGKWWVTKERWGGGPGGEVGEAQGASDGPVNEASVKSQEISGQRNPDGSKARRRPTPAEAWKTLKPGLSLWDPKVVYEAIGKDRNVEWDDVRLAYLAIA